MGILYSIKTIPEVYIIVSQILLLILIFVGLFYILPDRGFINTTIIQKYIPKIITDTLNKKTIIYKFIPSITDTCKGINQPKGGEGCNSQCYPFGYSYYDAELGGCFNYKFDAKCYKQRYSDLVNYTDSAAETHWKKHGIKEFRNGSCYDEFNDLNGQDKYKHYRK